MKKVIVRLLSISLIVSLTACTGGVKDSGKFKVVDGKELFFDGENQIIDRLVTVGGEKYYIGENGSKVKNDWAVIDNEGTYAYFGAKGVMIFDTIKEINNELYIFDKEGKLETNGLIEKDGDKYFATKDGHLLKSQFKIIDGKDNFFGNDGKQIVTASPSWVNNINTNGLGDLPSGYYYLDNDGQRIKNTWIEGYYLGENGLMATDTWIGTGSDRVYVGKDGKKETDYKEVVGLIKDIFGSNDKTNNSSTTKQTWELTYYVDSFGDFTSDKYIAGYFSGTFSNTLFKENKCDFKFLIGENYTDIMFYEYGSSKVEGQTKTFDVTIKKPDGAIVNCIGYFNDDRMSLDSNGDAVVKMCLQGTQNFKILIEPQDSYSNSYLVEVSPDNFKEVYWIK